MGLWLILPVVALGLVSGQMAAPEEDVGPLDSGVAPPEPIRRVPPRYTPQAVRAQRQGIVLLEIVIDRDGSVTEVSVVSPLGFGLDESARQAVRQWKFKAATKDGAPVKVRAAIEMNFRLRGSSYDARAEQWRTAFNGALRGLRSNDENRTARAVETLRGLSRQGFPPAMYMESALLEEGKCLPRDPGRSWELLAAAAAKEYGPAMYEVGRMHVGGRLAASPDLGKPLRQAEARPRRPPGSGREPPAASFPRVAPDSQSGAHKAMVVQARFERRARRRLLRTQRRAGNPRGGGFRG